MISKLANIDASAIIGEQVKIASFSTIYNDVEIGDGTDIGPNVTIYPGARIGKNCKIFPGAVISAIPQDLKFNGEYSTTEIGDGTVIREGVTIHRGTVDRNKTVIGKNCLLMCYVHIGHDCLLGDNVVIANTSNIAGHCTIDDHAIIEGMVGVQQFVNIGAHAFIAGMSRVRKDVPPYIRVAREPLSYAGVNSIGLRRRGLDDEAIKEIESIYRILFVMNNSISKGIEQIEEEIRDSKHKKEVIEFIQKSDKGIIKGLI
ncbi:acyl-[acyl-carrier-protein]--UDP-N-acetylglucosamine O-acyltransferase [Putridiphycobacter roseus]|uniref:Acyl-[acyl-carrier-protein]--UDP-N-acetylglucosamine O-acyltransferase n=1 Tax=Putridiphycobacter roseus TaxID=2219161 RepID=A0A2W1MYE4_9FLAO|nr:acyl-ACP--UDP-N-acetylglucosamine O-acyltransferase [Putridiphycobacter roseus]PZE16877.1 acyl-[acyl-carrier-protein]--UDP-N-acetylglucosamine O-acyltransferase [Putridiphycobacter roseus]